MKKIALLLLVVLIPLACVTAPTGDKPASRSDLEASAELFGKEPPRVASDFQAWADANGNGILEPPELQEFLEAVRLLTIDVHRVTTPVDEFFDFNRDGEIGPLEWRQAQLTLFQEQPRRFYVYDPDLARYFDMEIEEPKPNIYITEAKSLSWQVIDPDLRNPRAVRPGLDRKIDANRDGQLDEAELETFTRNLFISCALFPLEEVIPFLRADSKEEIFSYTDLDNSGSLEKAERDDLAELAKSVMRGPGKQLLTPIDAYFDINRDLRVSAGEMEIAREQLIIVPLRRYFQINPEGATELIDWNGNGRIDESEVTGIIEAMFGFEPVWQFREEYDAPAALRERLDRNRDGRVDHEEMGELYHSLVYHGAFAWLNAPETGDRRWRVASALDELIDLNGDGFVDQKENGIARDALEGPHPVRNAFDKRIDVNGDGQVSELEVIRARRAGEMREAPAEEQLRSLPVTTMVDKYFDLNGDSRVEEEEIQTIVRAFLQPEESRFPGRWMNLLDLNNDGRVEREELVESRERFLRPHPVDPDARVDRELDRNRDGFVAPEEIGIAAGYTAGRAIPSFDERLEQLGWREEQQVAGSTSAASTVERYESEYYKKLGQIQDKKLAVVGINSGTKNVNEETASGVMVFIENAFVNVGKVHVVDRQNITKIVKEYEFQAGDLTDETTAVEIGKLSGADIIVIGSISYVGDNYYLNIKLISVETAEIIGSSIADALNANEFYEMCNEAVYKLF